MGKLGKGQGGYETSVGTNDSFVIPAFAGMTREARECEKKDDIREPSRGAGPQRRQRLTRQVCFSIDIASVNW